jgi:thiol-disulfide isomerase/thioredoxin
MDKLFLGLFLSLFFFSCKENVKESVVDEPTEIENVEVVNDSIPSAAEGDKKAPDFSLMDIDGNLKSLDSYKGKLVLLDIWATWCGPCLANVPYIKELEEKYKDKNFQVLSVSIDAEKDKEKWKNMVIDKKMAGEHLFAGVESRFPLDYQITYIPRFVLISPDGKIINDDAPQVINEAGNGIDQDLIELINQNLK